MNFRATRPDPGDRPPVTDALAVRTAQFLEDDKVTSDRDPARILAIILVALIDPRACCTGPSTGWSARPAGGVPRILRPLKERIGTARSLESTGLLSERRAQRAATIGSVLKSTRFDHRCSGIAVMLILGELQVDLAPFIAGTSIVGVAARLRRPERRQGLPVRDVHDASRTSTGSATSIDFEKATGTVEAVGLRITRLRDVNGTVWYVRNGEVVRVGNKSQGFAAGRARRPDRRVGRRRRGPLGDPGRGQSHARRPRLGRRVPRRAGGAGRRVDHPRGDRDPAGRPHSARASSGGSPASCAGASAQRLDGWTSRHPRADDQPPPATNGGTADLAQGAGPGRDQCSRWRGSPRSTARCRVGYDVVHDSQRAHRHPRVHREGQQPRPDLAAGRADHGRPDQHAGARRPRPP